MRFYATKSDYRNTKCEVRCFVLLLHKNVQRATFANFTAILWHAPATSVPFLSLIKHQHAVCGMTNIRLLSEIDSIRFLQCFASSILLPDKTFLDGAYSTLF